MLRASPPFIHDGAASVRQLFATLCRLPEAVRRFAQESVAVIVVGAGCRGLVVSRAALDAAESVVVLAAGDSLPDTLAHELAHALEPHLAGVESERAAAALARAWGFEGPPASPYQAEQAYVEGVVREAPPDLRAQVTPDSVALSCATCGRPARFLAPTVAGMRALLAAECPACPGCGVFRLEDLVPCATCSGRCGVTWSEGATPEKPVATWACTCGAAATRELLAAAESPGPPPRPLPEDPEAARLEMAARTLLRVDEELHRLGTEPDIAGCPMEACRSSVWWVLRLVSRARADLTAGDAREPFITDAADELARAGRALATRDVGTAGDAVAKAARVLDTLSTAAVVGT